MQGVQVAYKVRPHSFPSNTTSSSSTLQPHLQTLSSIRKTSQLFSEKLFASSNLSSRTCRSHPPPCFLWRLLSSAESKQTTHPSKRHLFLSSPYTLVSRLTSPVRSSCDGSSLNPNLSECTAGLNGIDKGATYDDGAEFSVGSCYIKYATNKSGKQSLSGQVIYDTGKSILDTCGGHKGSYPTHNCDKCHVTINYRRPR